MMMKIGKLLAIGRRDASRFLSLVRPISFTPKVCALAWKHFTLELKSSVFDRLTFEVLFLAFNFMFTVSVVVCLSTILIREL